MLLEPPLFPTIIPSWEMPLLLLALLLPLTVMLGLTVLLLLKFTVVVAAAAACTSEFREQLIKRDLVLEDGWEGGLCVCIDFGGAYSQGKLMVFGAGELQETHPLQHCLQGCVRPANNTSQRKHQDTYTTMVVERQCVIEWLLTRSFLSSLSTQKEQWL